MAIKPVSDSHHTVSTPICVKAWVWQQGDQQLPAFQEAQAYLQKAGALQQVGVR